MKNSTSNIEQNHATAPVIPEWDAGGKTCIQIWDSFTTGQGKTNDAEGTGFKLSDKMSVRNLELRYMGHALTFQNEAHKNAMLGYLVYKAIYTKSDTDVVKMFNHINSGSFLSLNHTSPTAAAVDIWGSEYKEQLEEFGCTALTKAGKGSKLFILHLTSVKADLLQVLQGLGIIVHAPVLTDYVLTGIKVELPKSE